MMVSSADTVAAFVSQGVRGKAPRSQRRFLDNIRDAGFALTAMQQGLLNHRRILRAPHVSQQQATAHPSRGPLRHRRLHRRGLRRDLDAVTAGLTLPWSSGPVEGHVNRIKTIKRQMFGRAKPGLLRKRILLSD